MKANYTKPLLAMEMFSYSQTNARDCADNVPTSNITLNDPNNCGWAVGNMIFFLLSGNVCTMNGEGMSGFCYNNPSEGNYIFRS